MEKNGFKKIDLNVFVRNVESSYVLNLVDECMRRFDDRWGVLRWDEVKLKLLMGWFENEKWSEIEEISFDENEDVVRYVLREFLEKWV